jgi:FtsH-binding integral membrane protein
MHEAILNSPLLPALRWLHGGLAVALLGTGLWAILARKSKSSSHPIAGEIYFWLLVVTGVTGVAIGLRHAGVSVFEIATPPSLVLGTLGYLAAKRRPGNFLGKPWLRWHLGGMGGSYIGVATATCFQIVPRLVPRTTALTVVLFAVPAALGTILIRRASARWFPSALASTGAEGSPP